MALSDSLSHVNLLEFLEQGNDFFRQPDLFLMLFSVLRFVNSIGVFWLRLRAVDEKIVYWLAF